jgi:nucleoside 2-deoxyribosyltransferase
MSDAQSEPPYLTVDLLDKIKEKSLPTPSEAANRLLTWIGSNTKEFGEPILCDDLRLGGLVGVRSEQSLFAIIRALSERHFLNFSPTPSIEVPGPIEVTLTMTGWEHYEFLKRSAVDVSTAFIAMPFGEPDLTAFVDTHMRPAVAETGFTLRRADDAQRAGRIDDQMRLDIRNCRFLIADLTHGNRGAFWEAGYAEGLGKTVIYTCRKDKFHDADARHFDTNNHLTVKWTYEDPKSAMTSLKNTIRNSIPEAKQQDG